MPSVKMPLLSMKEQHRSTTRGTKVVELSKGAPNTCCLQLYQNITKHIDSVIQRNNRKDKAVPVSVEEQPATVP
jgi:hypothetical protein